MFLKQSNKAVNKQALTFSSVFRAGLGGCGWGTLKPRSSSIFSAAFRLATFLLGPIPSAFWPVTDTWVRGKTESNGGGGGGFSSYFWQEAILQVVRENGGQKKSMASTELL